MSTILSQPADEIQSAESNTSQPQIEENLDLILAKLCALSDEEAAKEGKLKANSAFKLSSLKLIARKRGMVTGTAKPEMITLLRASVLKEKELKNMDDTERNGTYKHDKNTVPRLVNLIMRYPDALQRSSALATRMDLQNKTVNSSKPIWVTVAEEFMDGTDSGGLVKNHEKFIKYNIDPELISKNGIFMPLQAFELFKELSRAYAIVKKRYEASGQHNGKDFLDFCGQLTHSTQLDMLYLHESLAVANNPELAAFCVEGNVIEGGLDTADAASTASKDVSRKAKKKASSNFDAQEEMVKIMKLRREDELKSQAISMRKDLNLSLAVLHNTWHELDKTLITLEDSADFETNPRKSARHSNYKLKMAENEEEMSKIKLELKRLSEEENMKKKQSDILDEKMNITMATEDSENFAVDVVGDFHIDLNDSLSSDDLHSRFTSSSITYCCCGCLNDASHTSHFCSVTEKHVMAFCLSEGTEEGYGSRGICKGCAAKSSSSLNR